MSAQLPRQGPANGSPHCGPHSLVWPGLWVYAGCSSLAPLPTAHCLPHLCVGSTLHRGTSPILSPGTVLLHCYYSASYLIALFCPGGVAGPPNADCYPTAFSVAGPTDWNGLPVVLRLTPVVHSVPFLFSLKITLFDRGWAGSAP